MELAEPEPLAVNPGNSEAIKLRGMITKSSPAITTILQRRRPLEIIRQLSLKPTRITELSLEQEDTGGYRKIQEDTGGYSRMGSEFPKLQGMRSGSKV